VVAGLVTVLVALAATGCGSGESGDRGAADRSTTTAGAPTTDTTFAFTVPGGGAGDYDEIEVTIGAAPYEVPGTIRVPADATTESPVPGALIVGDFGPQDEDGTVLGRKPLRDLGQGLAERGVATLTFEKRTFTYQEQLERDASVGIEADLLDDAGSALGQLRETEGVDPERLFVVGHGFGGSVSPRVADAGGGVAGLVAVASPARPMQGVLVDEARYLANLDGQIDEEEQGRISLVESQADRIDDPNLSPDVLPGDALGASGLWWLDQRGYDAATALANAQLPVLIVLGGRDYRANERDVEGWQVATDASGLVRVEVIDDLDHLLAAGEGPSTSDDYASADKVDARVLESIATFIQSPPS
jgi:dienelactone hydrolase